MRPPSPFSEVSAKPNFLRTTPAKKPRTECCCHPVTFMIAAIVVPLACLSRPRTVSCLVRPRAKPEVTFPGFAGFFPRFENARDGCGCHGRKLGCLPATYGMHNGRHRGGDHG